MLLNNKKERQQESHNLKISYLLFKNKDAISIDIHFSFNNVYNSHISINRSLAERHFGSLELFQNNLKQQFVSNIVVKDTFIDIVLSPLFFEYCCEHITFADIDAKQPINLEYCSANPTGLLHIGNVRNIVLGECIKKFFSFFDIKCVSEYYVNDMGNQLDELLHHLQNHEYGEYLNSLKLLEKQQIHSTDDISQFFCDEIKKQLQHLNIVFDIWTSEKKLNDLYINDSAFNDAVDLVAKKEGNRKYVYNEVRKCFLFKENNQTTYLLRDFMYMYDKKQRGFCNQFVVLGFDHNEYKKALLMFARAIDVSLTIVQTQNVSISTKNKDRNKNDVAKDVVTHLSKRKSIVANPVDYSKTYLFEIMSSCDNQDSVYFSLHDDERQAASCIKQEIEIEAVEKEGTMNNDIVLFLFVFNAKCLSFSKNFEISSFSLLFKKIKSLLLHKSGTLNIKLALSLKRVVSFLSHVVYNDDMLSIKINLKKLNL